MLELWNWLKDLLGWGTVQRNRASKPFGYCTSCGVTQPVVGLCHHCTQNKDLLDKYETLVADLNEAQAGLKRLQVESETKIKEILADAKNIDEQRKEWKARAVRLQQQLEESNPEMPKMSDQWARYP